MSSAGFIFSPDGQFSKYQDVGQKVEYSLCSSHYLKHTSLVK